MLSYHAIRASHFGQKLRFGLVMLMWFGTRQITTFRNDPKMPPTSSEATNLPDLGWHQHRCNQTPALDIQTEPGFDR